MLWASLPRITGFIQLRAAVQNPKACTLRRAIVEALPSKFPRPSRILLSNLTELDGRTDYFKLYTEPNINLLTYESCTV